MSQQRMFAMNLYLTGGGAEPLAVPPIGPEGRWGVAVVPPGIMDGYYSNPTAAFTEYHLGAKVAKFRNSGEKYMLIESDRVDLLNATNGAWAMDDSTVPKYAPWTAASGVWSFRHSGLRMNAMYMDGHVESLKWNVNMRGPRYTLPD
jgi:prepilin-type processing-associated H-X9-DG protein